MYDILDIAKYIVSVEAEHKRPVTYLRLQNMLYFLQAFWLMRRSQPLFNNDIIATEFGVRIEEVYYNYRIFGSSCIPKPRDYSEKFLSYTDKEYLDSLLERLSKYSTNYLTDRIIETYIWKHSYYSAWSNVITIDNILEYYKDWSSNA